MTIPYLLTRKAERALSFHPINEDMVPSPWDCADDKPLNVREAREVLAMHGNHRCPVSRTARKTLARLIDAPTVRARVYRFNR